MFDLELAPVEIETKKGTQVVSVDEHPRPETSLEKISSLRPVFKKDGVVTAANASGICDGAGECGRSTFASACAGPRAEDAISSTHFARLSGTIILASEDAVKEHDLKPLARLASYQVSGCEPSIMGIGPVPAIRGALASAGLTLDQVDRVEINEAFAAQFLACAKELGLDMDRTNLHGGAISLGHPLGASGSRIVAHLANEFQRSDGDIYVGSACIGGGQGIAVVLERV